MTEVKRLPGDVNTAKAHGGERADGTHDLRTHQALKFDVWDHGPKHSG